MKLLNEIKYLGILRTLKFAYQRAVRGYDDSLMWGFSGYLNDVVIPPLKEFCKNQRNEEYNQERVAIYQTTIDLIERFENMPYENNFKEPNEETEMWKFIGQHIQWYWD